MIQPSNIVKVLKDEPTVDLVSYDYMLAAILKTGLKNTTRQDHSYQNFDIEAFLRLSLPRNLTPTKEQLCLLSESILD